MVGDGADSALGGGPVRQHRKVGGREIILYLGVFDVMGEQSDSVFGRRTVDQPLVFVERSVWLARNDELVTVVQSGESLQQNVQPFIFPDQPEKQQVSLPRCQPESLFRLTAGQLLAEVLVDWMEKCCVQSFWREPVKVFRNLVAQRYIAGAA